MPMNCASGDTTDCILRPPQQLHSHHLHHAHHAHHLHHAHHAHHRHTPASYPDYATGAPLTRRCARVLRRTCAVCLCGLTRKGQSQQRLVSVACCMVSVECCFTLQVAWCPLQCWPLCMMSVAFYPLCVLHVARGSNAVTWCNIACLRFCLLHVAMLSVASHLVVCCIWNFKSCLFCMVQC